jgi:hypothetical protein
MIRKTLVTVVAALLGVCSHTDASQKAVGKNLREIIEHQIRENVRQSTGELAGQNFSDVDLERFKREDRPGRIVTALQADRTFLDAVEHVRKMPAVERSTYLKNCRQPLRKTWAEMGRIASDGSGTTAAGRVAELAISNAIVDLAERLLKKS